MPARTHNSKKLETPHRRGAASLRLRVVVMAKEPVLGRVKTRLAREIGAAAATRLYRSAAGAVLARIGRDPRFKTMIGMSPDTMRQSRSQAFPAKLARIGQGQGDLGVRMLRLAGIAPLGPVVIVGTDIPGITGRILFEALRLLGRNDVVFGPAPDGGFWLVGFSRRRPIASDIFDNVRWSHEATLVDVLANCRELKVGFAATLSDVDALADLRRLGHIVGRRVLPLE